MYRKKTPFDPYKKRFERALTYFLPKKSDGVLLHQAMHYAMGPGGKRLRPLLVYVTGTLFGANLLSLDQLACAIECIHVYSLIHDDLPAMDNAAMRHHQPACHLAFDEATAILTGNALQCLAFEHIATHAEGLSPWIRLAILNTLTKASGAQGMVGGQMLDIHLHPPTSIEDLDTLYKLKTGALIQAAVRIGVLAAHVDDQPLLTLLDNYAIHLALAFQIQDDILDLTHASEALGKTAGIDAINRKPTYPQHLGMDAAKNQMDLHYQKALDILRSLPLDAHALIQLTESWMHREK